MTALGGERAALVEAVVPFLDEWQRLLRDARQLTPDRIDAMVDRAEGLRRQAESAAEGGIAHHLQVCVTGLRAPALDRRSIQETLRNLSEVTWQLKQELGTELGRPLNLADGVGARSIAPPPLLTGEPRGGLSELSPGRGSVVAPPPISLPGRSLAAGPAQHQESGRIDPRVPGRPVVAAAGAGKAEAVFAARPGPRDADRASPAPILSGLGADSTPPALQRAPAPAEPAPKAPPIAPGKDRDKPNLMVATMFGLRAFGRGGKAPGIAAPARPAHESAAPRGGVLGLGRGASPRESGAAPGWVGPRADGLPDLATGRPSAALRGDDLDERLRQLRSGEEGDRRSPFTPHPSGAERSNVERARSGAPQRASRADNAARVAREIKHHSGASRRDAGFAVPWWVGLVAVALVGLVVVLVLILGRSRVAAPTQVAAAAPVLPEAEIPKSRLLDDKERMKSLISQVHGYGGQESPELADLLNEEAALVYQVMEQKCQEPGDKCQSAVPVVAGTLPSGAPQHQIHDLFEERKIDGHVSRGTSQNRPKWLAGLSIPAIGAEDDPNVRRLLEYYTEHQVGREEFQNMLFRCGSYQDLIEKTLVHYGLPRALMALVMTESGCVADIESPVGARGLWQFMPATARAYHLHVKESVVDERISPPKSTEAAVKFLADLYRKMGSWEFALASYNMGPFGLSARIRRAGGDVTFWDLAAAGFLPDETAKYVPRIQAYALILENLGRFNFSAAQMRAPDATAEMEVPQGTRLGQVAKSAGTSLTQLKLLNPDIVGTVVPDLPGSHFMLQVPKEVVFRARTALEQLLAAGDSEDRCVSSGFDWGRQRFTPKMAASCQRAPRGR